MAKKIGILGGKNHSLTMEYYYLVYRNYYTYYSTFFYPEVILYSLNYNKILEFEKTNDVEEYTKYIAEGIHSLEKAGADAILMIADTCNLDFNELKKTAKVQVFNMAEVLAKRVKEKKIKKVILLGESNTIKNSSYVDFCKEYGIDVINLSHKEQEEIDKIFFDELFVGISNSDSKKKLLKIIKKYDVDGAILTSSEFSILLNQEETDVYIFNVFELHIQAGLKYLYEIYKKVRHC